MTDRENIIRHFQDAISASGDGNRWRFVRADIIEDAIAILREQEPIKPRFYTGYGRECWCGQCGSMIYSGDDYCSHCGRRIKWDV